MFNTVAHSTTAYYYFHVLRHIVAIRAPDASNPVLAQFVDSKYKLLTNWGLASQLLLFVLCLVHDVTRLFPESSPLRRAARSARDLVMAGLAGPLALTVAALFWGLYWVDRELVLPSALDDAVPSWLNHAMHSFVVILVVVQLLAEPHHAPALGACVAIGSTLFVAYMFTLFGEFAASGRWLYPVFGELDWAGRAALVILAFAIYLVLIVLIRAVVRARWGDSKAKTKKRKD